MEWKPDRKKAAARLALCGGLAAVLYGAAVKLPALEEYRPWLEEHRLEAGVVTAAVLFGLSLLAFPLPEGTDQEEDPDDDPCDGYSPVE